MFTASFALSQSETPPEENIPSLTGVYQLQKTAVAGGLGGPQSVSAQIEQDRLRRLRRSRNPKLDQSLQSFEDFQARLNEEIGLFTRFDYQAVGQYGNNSLSGDGNTAAGHVRLLGKWNILDRGGSNPGSFVFLLQQKHKLGTELTPAELAGDLGYIGTTAVSFGDVGSTLAVANWQQTLAGGRAGVVIGLIDPTDYTDILGYANQRTTFMNGTSLVNLTVAAPGPGFGFAAGGMITDQIYAVGVISDANGSGSEVKWFPGGSEFYSYGEIGWTPSKDQRYMTNVHVGAWNIDERQDAGIGGGQGIVISGNVTVDGTWMPFARIGWASGDAANFETAVTGGFIYYLPRYGDLFGFAASRNDPSSDSLRDQTTLEAFYRYNLSDNISITADAQYLINPSLHPTRDSVGVFGVRFRLAM